MRECASGAATTNRRAGRKAACSIFLRPADGQANVSRQDRRNQNSETQLRWTPIAPETPPGKGRRASSPPAPHRSDRVLLDSAAWAGSGDPEPAYLLYSMTAGSSRRRPGYDLMRGNARL